MQLERQGLERAAKPVVMFLAIVGATAPTAWLLAHPQNPIFIHITKIAAWLKGGPMPEVVTWPAWGYAWVVALLPSWTAVIVLQACVSAAALTWLLSRLSREMPRHGIVLTVLILLAVPWHYLQTDLYPPGLAGSFVLLSLLTLGGALAQNSVPQALLAGVLAGLAQNFRTEFVLLPAFIGASVAGLGRFGRLKLPSFKPVWGYIITALAFQLPWAGFYYAHAGRFALTESSLGHVLYCSLGKHPNNPWGITGDDEGAQEEVRNEGYSCSSLSEQGNRVLLRCVLQKMKTHPYGVAQRTLHQLKDTVAGPFNWQKPKLDERGMLDLEVLWQELKARLGLAVDSRKLRDYRSRDLYPDSKRDKAAVSALLYRVGATALGSLVMLLGIAGMILVALHRSLVPATPLLYLFGCTAIYKMLLDVLLLYQSNYLSNVYPMFLPFLSISLAAMAALFGKEWRASRLLPGT